MYCSSDIQSMQSKCGSIHAVPAWFSIDSCEISHRSYGSDSQERIDKCLACMKPECINCFENGEFIRPIGSPRKVDLERLRYLLSTDRTIPEICNELHISKRTFYYNKKKIGEIA